MFLSLSLSLSLSVPFSQFEEKERGRGRNIRKKPLRTEICEKKEEGEAESAKKEIGRDIS